MEYIRRKVVRPTEDAQLSFQPGSSNTTLALLDVETGGESDSNRRRNGYLAAPTPSPSDRSRSTSPLYLDHNGFLFPRSQPESQPKQPESMMRCVSKSGECYAHHRNIKSKGLKYLADIFTTLVDCRWRWCAAIFSMGFFSTWLFYATLYYLFAWLHDDLDKTNLDQSEWMPCINKIRDFTSAYLYSLETQHTIGYGYRFANTECPHVIIVLCLQCLTGVALQSILVGVLFAKLSRPKMRSETLMFSKEACICQRDGRLHFMFRLGDMRRSHIVEAHVRVMCMKERITWEGEEIPLYQYDMDVGFSNGTDRLFLVWPTIVTHEIDDQSPLYDISADDLKTQRLEIIVILEGIVEATGLTTQARTSYLPNEIRWGYRFEKVVRPVRDGSVKIDHDYFNKIYYVESTPRLSARELYRLQAEERLATEEHEGVQLAPLQVPNPASLQRRRRSSLGTARKDSTSGLGMLVEGSRDNSNTATVPEIMIRRASNTLSSYQADPLSCAAENSVLPVQNVELPRIR